MATKEPPADMRARKITIKPSRSYRKHADCDRMGIFAWTKSPAFVANPRGILVHRVRHVSSYVINGRESHHHVDYLCGNGCNVDLENIVEALVADPPRDRLLCENCELRAKRFKLPTGDQLAKRHVHRGVLVPHQTCCRKH